MKKMFLLCTVLACFAGMLSANDAAVDCTVVPAMSPYRHLPGEKILDAKPGPEIGVIMAKNEIGSASFLLRTKDKDQQNVMITVSDLVSASGGKLPASAVTVRIVKYWYQDGTAWASYFADPNQQELVPELLLFDDDLVRVDRVKKQNFLRVGKTHRWMNYPEKIRYGLFNYLTEPVEDAKTLQPFALTKAEGHKKFFVTVKAPAKTADGIYHGTLTVKAAGNELLTRPLIVRVLPFELPRPKTWYNREKNFLPAMRIADVWHDYIHVDRDFKKLEAFRKMMYASMREHNIDYPLHPDTETYGRFTPEEEQKIFRANLEWIRDAGFPRDMMLGGIKAFSWNFLYQKEEKWPKDLKKNFFERVDNELKITREIMGDQIKIYPEGWNEPGLQTLVKERPTFKELHKRGTFIQTSGKNSHLTRGGHNTEIVNMPGLPKPSTARPWHDMGNQVTSYAMPHTGVENPDYIRRTHAVELYKADFDGTCNYHYLQNGAGNIWRDTNGTFRTFSFIYATPTAIIDTLEYEAYRTGIDDIRYATLLCQLAEEAVKRTDNVDIYYAGKLALRFISLTQADRENLDTFRLEMIEHILKLRKMLAAAKGEK